MRKTQVLEFQTGLETRPLLRPASPEEQILDGGTRVRVWLNRDPEEKGGLLARPNSWGDVEEIEDFGALCAWLAPALDVDLHVEDEQGFRRVVAASDWLTMDGVELIARVGLQRLGWGDGALASAHLLRILQDPRGQIFGRATIFHEGGTYGLGETRRALGVVTVGGLRAQEVEGIAGVLAGSTDNPSRRLAEVLADEPLIASWASEQAVLIAGNLRSPVLRFTCAGSVVAYGGDPGNLPIAKRGEDFVNFETLACWKDAPDKIALFPLDLGFSTVSYREWILHPHVLGTHDLTGLYRPRLVKGSMAYWIRNALAKAWACSYEEISVSRTGNYYEVGTRRGKPEERYGVTILHKPSKGVLRLS